MQSIEGRFYCGQLPHPRKRQSREVGTLATKRMKAKQPTAIVTMEDFRSVYTMMNIEDSKKSGE